MSPAVAREVAGPIPEAEVMLAAAAEGLVGFCQERCRFRLGAIRLLSEAAVLKRQPKGEFLGIQVAILPSTA